MRATGKDVIKSFLGQLPLTAELYWLLRQRGRAPAERFSLKHLQGAIPELVKQASSLRLASPTGKKIFVFASLHYWIEHIALLGTAMAAQGHQVKLGFLPFSDWQSPANRFDLRRQNAYARKVLSGLEPLVEVIPFFGMQNSYLPLPEPLKDAVEQVTLYDAQYTLQVEEPDPSAEIYKLRLERNTDLAQKALVWLKANQPDVVIVPNGTIQEMGVMFRVAKYLKIPVTTYEFGDQRQRIWVSLNSEVMRQETDAMWKIFQNRPLEDHQLERLRNLFAARQRAAVWENFTRRWQAEPAQGAEQARTALGLDDRPVVLLATNVLGDSLTLGRQVFSKTMAEWIGRTVQYFIGRPDIQLVIRIHPGEKLLKRGQSMVDVVHEVLPRLPEHIRLIGPNNPTNTYDLIAVADLGLVYTTTVGLEMAMSGVPVMVAGQTHYRGRGFTIDPESWVTYFKQLGQILDNPRLHQMNRAQVDRAWQYAYRFFFDFPRPFPWHLVRTWEDFSAKPFNTVFGPEGQKMYGKTFRYLVGELIDWKEIEEETVAANGTNGS